MTAGDWPVRAGIAAFYFFGITANGLWYYAKFLLRANGYRASYIWHFGDLGNLRRLAQAEADPQKRTKYFAVLIGIYVSAALFFLMAFLFFFPYASSHPGAR
jgi:hypothetical protein